MTEKEVTRMERAIETAKRVYGFNGAGGALHIVLDDGNIETGHIEWSIRHVSEYSDSWQEVVAAVLCGEAWLALTEKEREEAYGRYFEYFGGS